MAAAKAIAFFQLSTELIKYNQMINNTDQQVIKSSEKFIMPMDVKSKKKWQ